MAYISLIVKGDKFAAAKAAAEHGIGMLFIREVRDGARVETVGHCSIESHATVAAWFAEDANKPAPFAVGSLLLFTVKESE